MAKEVEKEVQTAKDEPEKVKISGFSKLRSSKNFRLIVIVGLMVIVAALFFFWGKAKVVLIGIFAVLLIALGLETTGNDWDLGKMIETGSLEQSKVQQTKDGRWMIDDKCKKENLNCDNFTYQEEAQDLFEYCGGPTSDIHGLDGDKDGIVCEALKSNAATK